MNKLHILSGLAGSVSLFSCSEKVVEKPAPNIVVILADDLGYSDIQPYGSEIPTPNLNRLAEEGILFTRFNNAGSCSPSRASLLTGLYAHQAGMGGMADQHPDIYPYQGYLAINAVTVAELLKMKGYHTYMAGKWHVGNKEPYTPAHRGFDKSFAFLNGAGSYFHIRAFRDSTYSEQEGSSEPIMRYNGQKYFPPEQGFYATDAYTEKAIRFIEEDAGDDKPFFLYLAFNAPHWPLQAPAEIIENYRGNYAGGWDEVRKNRFERQKTLAIIPENTILPPRMQTVREWKSLTKEEKAGYDLKMAVYAAMVDRMDWNIGRLLNTLDSSGEREKTIIFFLSDNGADSTDEIPFTDHLDKSGPVGSEHSFTAYGPGWANVSNTPFKKQKASIFFGGIATPFIVSYPGVIEPGTRTAFRGHIIDLMPTILYLAGVNYPNEYNGHRLSELPGVNLMPVLKGENPDRHSPIYFEYSGHKGIIEDDWKLVALENNEWKLYNLAEDPTEMNDLSDSQKKKKLYLQNKWQNWADSVNVLPMDELEKYKRKN